MICASIQERHGAGKRRRTALAGVLLVLSFVIAGRAQDAGVPSLPEEAHESLRVNVNLVNMFFTVRDGRGQFVKHLERGDFLVSDNARPVPVTHFAEISEQPLALAIVLDKSGSVENHFDFERRATADFVRSVLRPGKDQALLISFDREPRLSVQFTDRATVIEAGMTGLQARGGTALFDAALLALKQLDDSGLERKVLILVTDGEDTVSWATENDALALALARNVTVYTLGVKADAPGAHEGKARRNLVRLSEETGGLALFPKDNPKELAELFGRIEEELRNQYSLGYPLPVDLKSEFHRVVIAAKNKSHQVHSRSGYYSAKGDGVSVALPANTSPGHTLEPGQVASGVAAEVQP